MSTYVQPIGEWGSNTPPGLDHYDSGAGWDRVADAMERHGAAAVLADPSLVPDWVATLTPVVGGWELVGDGIERQLILHDGEDVLTEATSVIVTETGVGPLWQRHGTAWRAYEAPTTWSGGVAPGGMVCAIPMDGMPDGICGMPVETEPCPEHAGMVAQ